MIGGTFATRVAGDGVSGSSPAQGGRIGVNAVRISDRVGRDLALDPR